MAKSASAAVALAKEALPGLIESGEVVPTRYGRHGLRHRHDRILRYGSSWVRQAGRWFADHGWVLSWEFRDCGKHCCGCPHGPYLYARMRYSNGRVSVRYVGR